MFKYDITTNNKAGANHAGLTKVTIFQGSLIFRSFLDYMLNR